MATEDVEWLAAVQAATSTPLAIGELFTNPREYVPLIRDRLLDFVRCHVSAIGGITPGRRVSNLCEFFAVQTAWHGPKDVSPVGQAANLALDVASPSFGIQEFHPLPTGRSPDHSVRRRGVLAEATEHAHLVDAVHRVRVGSAG